MSMGMSSGEIFPNAPLALVAAEVRYPAVTERPLGMAVNRQLRDAIGSDWVIHNDTSQTFEAGFGPAGPHASVRSDTIGRIISRTRSKIITVQPDRFVIEVADYLHFADFCKLLERTAAAVEGTLRPDGISRMGLRYIDEIAVPDVQPQWDRWLHPSLMAPLSPPNLVAAEWLGSVQYSVAPDQIVVFRYGPVKGPVVAPNGPLRRPRVPEGPIFMLDFDSSWQPVDIPEFSSARIAEMAGRLRAPLRDLFDSLATPALLEIFRQER